MSATPPFDWEETLASQYANSPTLLSLLDYASQSLDATDDIDMFYDLVWNVATAIGWGLDVWGRIVGVQRVLVVHSKFLGFEEALDTLDYDPFNQSPFYSGQPFNSNVSLSDDAFRLLILAKAASNITDCSSGSINAILMALFGDSGICYVADNLDMTMVYRFWFTLTPVQISIIVTANVLPKPTGVSVTVLQGPGAFEMSAYTFQNMALSDATQPMGGTNQARVVTAITIDCITAPITPGSTVDFYYAPAGTPLASGTKINTTSVDMTLLAANSLTSLALTSVNIPAHSQIGAVFGIGNPDGNWALTIETSP